MSPSSAEIPAFPTVEVSTGTWWHLCPRFPPQVCGVADYALTMQAAFEGSVMNLVADPLWKPEPGTGRALAVDHRQGLAVQLGKLGIDQLTVHYVCYGYSKRGFPFWLVRELAAWKSATPGSRLTVFFHELFVMQNVPFHTSVYWCKPFQRIVANRLILLADRLFTSNEMYASYINKQLRSDQSCMVLPVFSNFGEPSSLLPWDQRAPVIVIAGQAKTRAGAVELHRDLLTSGLAGIGCTEVVEFGPGESCRIPGVQVPWKFLGRIEREQASQILCGAKYGLMSGLYHMAPVTKSGIFAAYAAHGVIPVLRGEDIKLESISPAWCHLNGSGPGDPAAASQLLSHWHSGHNSRAAAAAVAPPELGPSP